MQVFARTNDWEDTFTFSWAAASVTGHVRSANEDAWVAESGLWAVADGMGGHHAGQVASRLVAQICTRFAHEVPLALGQFEQLVNEANQAVGAAAEEAGLSMGSTLVTVALVENGLSAGLAIANVGDSRCYILEGGRFRLATTDHSVTADLVASGAITEQEAANRPERHVVTRSIGIYPRVAADYSVLGSTSTRRVLLCSDGVSGALAPERLEWLARNCAEPNAAVEEIIRAVLSGQAADNATIVVVDITELADAALEAEDTQDLELFTTTNPTS